MFLTALCVSRVRFRSSLMDELLEHLPLSACQFVLDSIYQVMEKKFKVEIIKRAC